jgi:hypothetical protein
MRFQVSLETRLDATRQSQVVLIPYHVQRLRVPALNFSPRKPANPGIEASVLIRAFPHTRHTTIRSTLIYRFVRTDNFLYSTSFIEPVSIAFTDPPVDPP